MWDLIWHRLLECILIWLKEDFKYLRHLPISEKRLSTVFLNQRQRSMTVTSYKTLTCHTTFHSFSSIAELSTVCITADKLTTVPCYSRKQCYGTSLLWRELAVERVKTRTIRLRDELALDRFSWYKLVLRWRDLMSSDAEHWDWVPLQYLLWDGGPPAQLPNVAWTRRERYQNHPSKLSKLI